MISIHFSDISARLHTTKKPTTVVTDLHIWLSLNVPHTRSVVYFCSKSVVLSVAFQNQRPSEDDLFCCVLERKTRLVIHNRTCSLSYSFVVSCQSFVANIAAISDISNFKHNILYPIFITKRTWHKITSQSLLLRKWGYYLWGEYIYNE